jgi:hypothetical protein
MKTATILAVSSMIVLALAAFTTSERPAARLSLVEPSSFLAEMHGDLHVSPRGEARFGVIEGRDDRPSVFTLPRGADGADGSVLFTRTNGTRLFPGTYTIGGRDDGSDEIRALVMTGTASRPTDAVIRGRFQFDATGFLASDPENETLPMRATGMFTATRQ